MAKTAASGLPKGRIIEYVLGRLFERCPEIDAGIIATYEGLLLGANVRDNDEPENIGAVSSLLLENSTRIINEFNQGRLTQLFVLGTNGFTLLKNIGQVGFLTVTSKSIGWCRKDKHSARRDFSQGTRCRKIGRGN